MDGAVREKAGRGPRGRMVAGGAAFAVLAALLVSVTGTGFGSGAGAGGDNAADREKAAKARAAASYAQLPLSFEANVGQSDAEVDYLARGEGYRLFLTPSEAVLALQPVTGTGKDGKGEETAPASVLRMRLVGSDESAAPLQARPLPGKANYMVGDRSQWRMNVATFGEVGYRGVYPGVDVKYHGAGGALEYDFIVSPGADPGAIRMAMAGADSTRIDEAGDLVLATPAGEVRQHKPVLYQEIAGQRLPVSGNFVLRGEGEVGFEVGAYDPAAPLVIDPVLAYSTYLGGTSNDFGFGIAVDAAGNAFLGGQTNSITFPRGQGTDPLPRGATPGAFQTTLGGSSDAYILKMNPTGTSLVYATYIGGARADAGWDLAIDDAGNAYLSGATESADDPGTTAVEAGFPTTNGTNGTVAAYDPACGTDGRCNALLPPNLFADACDPLEPACNPADPSSPGYLPAICPPVTFPTGCATLPGPADNFLVKLSPAGDQLLYSTYFGGSGAEGSTEETPYASPMGIAVRGSTAYVTAATFSDDFPVTSRAFQPTCASCADGNTDSYLAVFDTVRPGAGGLRYSTFMGGNGIDEARAVAVDAAGMAYVTGTITGVDRSPGSTTFPVKNPITGTYLGSGAYDATAYRGGYSDAFVTQVDVNLRTGDTLGWSSFLGGGGTEEGWGVAVTGKAAGAKVYLTGYTTSGPNPNVQIEDPAHPGACAAAPDPVTGIRPWCDWASDPAPYFPVTKDAYDTTYNGRATTDSGSTLYLDGDAFVAKVANNGTQIGFSTYLGGVSADYGQDIALDTLTQPYITGWTTCRNQDPPGPVGPPPQFFEDGTPTGRNPGEPAQTGVPDCPAGFPTVNAPRALSVLNSTSLDAGQELHNSPTDVFVTKMTADGREVAYSVLLNGRGFDRGFEIAVRDPGPGSQPEAYVTGRTGSPAAPPTGCVPTCPFPITAGSYDTTYNGAGRDAFISKLVG
jgi:Beta-propeller repeat